MKNLFSLILLILITSPSYACACGGGSPIDTIAVLVLLIAVIFLIFLCVACFRDKKHIFRYASLVTFPSILISVCSLFFIILNGLNPDGEFFIGIILISFSGSIVWAEKKANNSKKEENKT